MIVFVLLSSPPAKASRVLLEVGVVKPDGWDWPHGGGYHPPGQKD
ncbi:unnamed protein product [Linum tenue]|uniref:Uncharacterized protein n=1 Tax=Linum tenue TaxID=586396 RepID=A0AAV0GYZ4_9ROSI|nr:unnamed protein product [Linum tenue]